MLHPRELELADRAAAGMAVLDAGGQQVGTVVQVHRRARVAPGDVGQVEEPPHPAAVEVRTGFLGLGQHLYIPVDAIADVTGGGLVLTLRRDELDREDWRHRPAYLEETR